MISYNNYFLTAFSGHPYQTDFSSCSILISTKKIPYLQFLEVFRIPALRDIFSNTFLFIH